MTGVGTVTIVWRGGEHPFCIARIGELLALEEACRAGVMEVLRRLESETWRINDVRETIRLGLIGGGMDPERAMVAVKLHVDGNPHGLAPSVLVAHAILAAAIIGVPEEPLGKTDAPEAATVQSYTGTMDASDAQPFTELGPDLDLPHGKSTNSQFGN